MEFLAIMFVGTLIAVLAVIFSRPVRRQDHPDFTTNFPEADQGRRNAEIWQWEPMDDFEYLRALDLYQQDPVHNPFPSDVPSRTSED
jgi:hypothetical protein